jgi:hypothetical protein
MAGISIDDKTVQSLVSKAIVDELGKEGRDLLITQALETLIKPNVNAYGREEGPPPINRAFEQAVQQASWEVAREVVKEHEELRAKLRELVGDVILDLLGGEEYSSSARTAIAQGFVKAVSDWLAGRTEE